MKCKFGFKRTRNGINGKDRLLRRMFENAGNLIVNSGKWMLRGLLLAGTVIALQGCPSSAPGKYSFDVPQDKDVWSETDSSGSNADLPNPEHGVKDVFDVPKGEEDGFGEVNDVPAGDGPEPDFDSVDICYVDVEPETESKACYQIEVPNECPTHTISTYIGDYIDRTLLDREAIVFEDGTINPESVYSLETSEVSPLANPFSNGLLGFLESVPLAVEAMYMVDGNMFTPLSNFIVEDFDASMNYSERQNIWISGLIYSADVGAGYPDSYVFSVSYSLKFNSPGGEFGIPVCTHAKNMFEYDVCDTIYRTDIHRISVNFLGEDWLILKMNPPEDEKIDNELEVANGGSVELGKLLKQDILIKGEELIDPATGLKFVLEDVDTESENHEATLNVYEPGMPIPIKEIKMLPGQTMDVAIPEYGTVTLHSFYISPGYTLLTKWIDLAILSKVLNLTDGQSVDEENPGLTVTLGWKNRGASSQDLQADHLRSIILSLDNNGNPEILNPGMNIPILENGPWALTFSGLDIDDSDRVSLTYELEKEDDKIFQNIEYEGETFTCTLYAPYVKVKTSPGEGEFCISGYCNYEFYIAGKTSEPNGLLGTALVCAYPNGEEGLGFAIGSVLIKDGTSPSAAYGLFDQKEHLPVDLEFAAAGSGVSLDTGGAIRIATDFSTVLPGLEEGTENWFSNLAISLSENSMHEPAQMPVRSTVFLNSDGLNSTFNFDGNLGTTETQYVLADTFYYEGTGITSGLTGGVPVTEGEYTERGSVFESIDDTSVKIKVAKEAGEAQFGLTIPECPATITITVCGEE